MTDVSNDIDRSPPRFSASQLEQYWSDAAAQPKGTSIRRISLSEMPPWSEICSGLPWRSRRAEAGFLTDKKHGFRGVYRLFAFSSDITRPAVFNRLCGQDATGTLYIGKANSLSNRLNQARRSAGSRREGSHAAAGRWARIASGNFPSHKLGIAFLFTRCQPRLAEVTLIDAYINSFGEMPPLNYKS